MAVPLDLPAVQQPLAEPTEHIIRVTKNGLAKPKAVYMMDDSTFTAVYGPEERADLVKLMDIDEGRLNDTSLLGDAEIIVSSWGAPIMDENFLAQAPHLRAVFYGAGSVRSFTTPAFWKRRIVVSSAYLINAQPVAEYTLGAILLSLKKFWAFSQSVKRGSDPWSNHLRDVPGAYQVTIGLVSVGMVARKVIQLLKSFEVRCIVYCPFLTDEEAAELGVERCSLAEVFELSDVVSIHTPLLAETSGLITGKLISSMKTGATLINTARGGVIRELEMVEILANRSDLFAILDVCDPEPPVAASPLIQLPNVVLTPHISGSLGPECRRLGRCMVEEIHRYLEKRPLQWQITEEKSTKLA